MCILWELVSLYILLLQQSCFATSGAIHIDGIKVSEIHIVKSQSHEFIIVFVYSSSNSAVISSTTLNYRVIIKY